MRFLFPKPARTLFRRVGQFSDWPLSARLVVTILPLSLVLVFTAFWLSYSVSSKTLREAVTALPLMEAKMQAGIMTRQMERIRKGLVSFARRGDYSLDSLHENMSLSFLDAMPLVAEFGVIHKNTEGVMLLRDTNDYRAVREHDAGQDYYSAFQQVHSREFPQGRATLLPAVQTDHSIIGARNGSARLVSWSNRLPIMRMVYKVPETDAIVFVGLDIQALGKLLHTILRQESQVALPLQEGRQQFSYYFDSEGWIVFEMANQGVTKYPDNVRRGYQGDLGRPGFDSVFRPAGEHANYWQMVMSAKDGHSGEIAPESGKAFSAHANAEAAFCYAPVFLLSDGEKQEMAGGIAFFETSTLPVTAFSRLANAATIYLLVAFALVGSALLLLGRSFSRPLVFVATALKGMVQQKEFHAVEGPQTCEEHHLIQTSVNALVGRAAKLQNEFDKLNDEFRRKRSKLPIDINAAPIPPVFYEETGLVGSSSALSSLRDEVQKAAKAGTDVLITGETGTGKEIVATAIHMASSRKDMPFISINCGALDENLLLDALFGHEKGAFSEAKNSRKGAFLMADKGTLFLDELANASPQVQQALLRALSVRRITPLGSDLEIPVNVRVIAATNADLKALSQQGAFREDLYYRLAIISISTPALKHHKNDIPELAAFFIHEVAEQLGKQPLRLTRGALEVLAMHDWPGNVRELRNCITRAVAFADGDLLLARHLAIDHTPVVQCIIEEPSPSVPQSPEMDDAWDRLPADYIWGTPHGDKSKLVKTNGKEPEGAALSPPVEPPSQRVSPPFSEVTPLSSIRTTEGPSSFVEQPHPSVQAEQAVIVAESTSFAADSTTPFSNGGTHGPLPQTGSQVNNDRRENGAEQANDYPQKGVGLAHAATEHRASSDNNTSKVVKTAGYDFNVRQKKALSFIGLQGGITRAEYQRIAGTQVSQRTVQNDLRQLVDWGILEKKGGGPATYYMLRPEARLADYKAF